MLSHENIKEAQKKHKRSIYNFDYLIVGRASGGGRSRKWRSSSR